MTTTIKVSDELRDRLKEQALRDGLTLGAHLARLADLDDRNHRLADFARAVAATTAPHAASHSVESAEWEVAELVDTTE